LYALAAAATPELVSRTTALLLNNTLPLQERRIVAAGLATAGPSQADAAFHYIMDNFDTLADQITLYWAQRFA